MDHYVVYVLYSKVYNKIYVGYTSNLIARFHSHNRLGTKGWTVRYRPWIVAYLDFFETEKEAVAREKQLKSAQGSEFIWAHIRANY